jgi:hypothetical protein
MERAFAEHRLQVGYSWRYGVFPKYP